MRVVQCSKDDVSLGWVFLCPGCKIYHRVVTHIFNGNMDRPTFSPSVLVTYLRSPRSEYCCHSFVKEGRIEFLQDCTHDLAGQTVDLPEITEDWC